MNKDIKELIGMLGIALISAGIVYLALILIT